MILPYDVKVFPLAESISTVFNSEAGDLVNERIRFGLTFKSRLVADEELKFSIEFSETFSRNGKTMKKLWMGLKYALMLRDKRFNDITLYAAMFGYSFRFDEVEKILWCIPPVRQ